MLKESIDEIAVQTYKLDYAFTMQIKELNAAINTGPFTQADRVYPYYKELSKIWKNIQLEGYLLDFYVSLFQELKEFDGCVNLIEKEKISEVELQDVSDYESADEEIPSIIFPQDIKNFQEVTLEYQGFCAYFCSMGILIPCKRELGIIRYKNLCYGFSTTEAFEYFNRQPEKCIQSVSQYMQSFPELILTFGMEKNFNFPIINAFKSSRVMPKFICDNSAQTVTHPIEKNIDTSYNWNQWSLRKQALKYADLLSKKTHSTQTDLSHFRRENFSQVYLPKNNWTQTRRDTGTTMARTGIPELNMKIRKSFL